MISNHKISNHKKSITAIHQFAESLANAIDAKDTYTEKHSLEVAEISRFLAVCLGLSSEYSDIIHIAGHLHDIGKIGVPDYILNKQERLTHDEWQAIRRHPQIGAEIISPVRDIADAGICEIVLHHHERYDGQGYPDGLKGNLIPLGARIIAAADSLSAMTGHRPYRQPMSFQVAITEIAACSGSQFDPYIINIIIRHQDKIKHIQKSLHERKNHEF